MSQTLNTLSGKSFVSSEGLSKEIIELILETAASVEASPTGIRPSMTGKILGCLFFEPSTRTRLSFESAMLKLGGQTISVENIASTSLQKGESLGDTAQVVSGYVDAIVMRHPTPGSVMEFAKYATVPVINAGDGPNQHPTQALGDLYTILKEKKTLSHLTIGFVGDLKYGRTVHSLTGLLEHYHPIRFVFISDPTLKMPQSITQHLRSLGHVVEETTDMDSFISQLDVLYVTRVQEERFEDKQVYQKVKDHYQISLKTLEFAKPTLTLLHPLPRVGEILPEVDHHPSAKYFIQTRNALWARAGLLTLILD